MLTINPHATAFIHENQCIGCTKCIQACPVDAISGGAKLMHTIIQTECTGCELCIPACPVDCISLISRPVASSATQLAATELANQRNHAQRQRLAAKMRCSPLPQAHSDSNLQQLQKQNYIQAALIRVQNKLKKDKLKG